MTYYNDFTEIPLQKLMIDALSGLLLTWQDQSITFKTFLDLRTLILFLETLRVIHDILFLSSDQENKDLKACACNIKNV